MTPVPRNQAKERPGIWRTAASRYRPIANATCKPQAGGRGRATPRRPRAGTALSSTSDGWVGAC